MTVTEILAAAVEGKVAGLAQERPRRTIVHSQVMRIREEDMRIGEAAGEGGYVAAGRDREKVFAAAAVRGESIALWRPSSPLGGKDAIKASLV